jgi:DNA-binding PadR family transcriptional regulator
MSNTSKNFDLREAFGDLLSQVKERAMDFGQPRSAAQPTSEMIEVAVLAALSEAPKNATEIFSNVGLSSAGSWVPTIGKIHSALTALTEGKKVSAKTDGDRKVYTITKAGKAALKEAAAKPVNESASARPSMPNMNLLNCDATFLKSATKLGPVMLDVAQTGTHEQQQAAAAALDDMRHKLHGILAGK